MDSLRDVLGTVHRLYVEYVAKNPLAKPSDPPVKDLKEIKRWNKERKGEKMFGDATIDNELLVNEVDNYTLHACQDSECRID